MIAASPLPGLAWLLAHRDNILLIPGTSSVVHLKENVKAGDLVLSATDLDLLTDRANH